MRERRLPENVLVAVRIIAEAIRRIEPNTLDYKRLKSEHTVIDGAAVTSGTRRDSGDGKWTKAYFKRTGA